MKSKSRALVAVVAVVLFVGANIGCSAEPAGSKGGDTVRKVPLIIGRVFLPDFTEEGAHGKPTERVAIETEYEPGDDVAACLIGAKLAGWAAGYEFLPVYELKKGEKARDIVSKLKTDSDVFVLVRVSTRTPNFGSGAMITVMGDAALYRKETMAPIESAGFVGVEKIDPKEIKGDKVHGEYWIKTVASQFASNFDHKFLVKMQTALDGKRIRQEVSDVQASASGTLSPAIENLPGGDKRAPELEIKMAKGEVLSKAVDDGFAFTRRVP